MAEFEEHMKSRGGDLQSVAREMSESVTDPDIQATEVVEKEERERGREGESEGRGGGA